MIIFSGSYSFCPCLRLHHQRATYNTATLLSASNLQYRYFIISEQLTIPLLYYQRATYNTAALLSASYLQYRCFIFDCVLKSSWRLKTVNMSAVILNCLSVVHIDNILLLELCPEDNKYVVAVDNCKPLSRTLCQ